MLLFFILSFAFAECPKIYCEEVLNSEGFLSGRCSVNKEPKMLEVELDEKCLVQWGAYNKEPSLYKLNQSLLSAKKTLEQEDAMIRLTKRELDELKNRIKTIEDGAKK